MSCGISPVDDICCCLRLSSIVSRNKSRCINQYLSFCALCSTLLMRSSSRKQIAGLPARRVNKYAEEIVTQVGCLCKILWSSVERQFYSPNMTRYNVPLRCSIKTQHCEMCHDSFARVTTSWPTCNNVSSYHWNGRL